MKGETLIVPIGSSIFMFFLILWVAGIVDCEHDKIKISIAQCKQTEHDIAQYVGMIAPPANFFISFRLSTGKWIWSDF